MSYPNSLPPWDGLAGWVRWLKDTVVSKSAKMAKAPGFVSSSSSSSLRSVDGWQTTGFESGSRPLCLSHCSSQPCLTQWRFFNTRAGLACLGLSRFDSAFAFPLQQGCLLEGVAG